MWIIVCRSPHWHLFEEVRHHFCRLAPHNPVFVRKRLSNDHLRRGNSKPGCRTVGSDTSALFATIAESQTSCHLVFISEVVKSNHSDFLERSRAACGQTHRCGLASLGRWSFIFSVRTSVAALRQISSLESVTNLKYPEYGDRPKS